MAANHLHDEKGLLGKPDAMLPYVKRRLEEWARWYTRGNCYGLGYPPCSLEYRILHEGMVRCRPPGTPAPLPIHEPAEEIERLVQQLSKQRPLLGEALRLYYFRAGSLRAETKARAISLTRLREQVEQACHWLAGWLTARLYEVHRMQQNKGLKNH